ncbi:Protein PAT1 -like protein 1 PAT1-like protein 1 [Takifugu flavidus]|uniref:Protein PAT1-like protein 1 PAT1-like protein 1 n=1 Tax=Takifugu flavidus TaxID=433684 RepID=A0A5C6MVB2_9TELE|nr:Protein PAT1 -like protein 1 PAT1-like protein 1 [Takifugu flavidus]
MAVWVEIEEKGEDRIPHCVVVLSLPELVQCCPRFNEPRFLTLRWLVFPALDQPPLYYQVVVSGSFLVALCHLASAWHHCPPVASQAMEQRLDTILLIFIHNTIECSPSACRTRLVHHLKVDECLSTVQFAGSLGKLTVSSVNNPRKMIDAVVTARSDDEIYSLLLEVQDFEKHFVQTSEEDREALLEQHKANTSQLCNSLLEKEWENR